MNLMYERIYKSDKACVWSEYIFVSSAGCFHISAYSFNKSAWNFKLID